MKLINECRVEFQYRTSPKGPIILETISSNRVETDLIKKILKVEKTVDKKCTYIFDILTYTINIINVCDEVIAKAFVQDEIPKETRFIENSVVVNNIRRREINPQDGFHIVNIKSKEKITIKFKVLVLPQYGQYDGDEIIKNYSIIEYDYLYNIEKPKDRININSNEVGTFVKNMVFNQITIDNNIERLCVKPDENRCLALIVGTIKYDITYKDLFRKNNKSYKKIMRVHFTEDLFGFSCCLIVPVGITYGNKYDINFIIEDSITTIINPNTLYLSTNILFYY